MKPNKDKIVLEMVTLIDKGLTFNECLADLDMVWGLSETTFARYWAEANRQYKAINEEIKEQAAQTLKDAAKDRLNRSIMTKAERMEVLTSIANGTLQFIRQVPSKFGPQEILSVPDYNDRKGAIAELNKMDGDYAPVKKDITSNGKEIKAITGIQVE